ncbi:MAG: hypothetical protein QOJ64_4437 [Acidobacteriota bacterium]|jgi:hypothetical protein|nr:hypothetical protein [Acidobacteriota bacterium]
MTDERIEEHKDTVTQTDEGTTESHTDRVVEQNKPASRPEVTTIEKETTIDED